MRLLTFNTLFRGDVRLRLRALGETLESSPYDLVCLQELILGAHLRLLRRIAPSYRFHAASGPGVLRGGLAVLSRHPVRSAAFTGYRPGRPVRPEWMMRKGFQVVRVAADGQEIAVVNTHLSANHDDDWSDGNRYTRVARAELERLAAAVNALALPVVVAGDLNVPRDSSVLAAFRTATGVTDPLAGDTRPTYRPLPAWPHPPAFDHVLVRGLSVVDAGIVLRDPVGLADGRSGYLSDHFGVDVSLNL